MKISQMSGERNSPTWVTPNTMLAANHTTNQAMVKKIACSARNRTARSRQYGARTRNRLPLPSRPPQHTAPARLSARPAAAAGGGSDAEPVGGAAASPAGVPHLAQKRPSTALPQCEQNGMAPSNRRV